MGELNLNALQPERAQWVVGEVNQDFFNIGKSGDSDNNRRTIQLFAYDISEFTGLTPAELADADSFQIQFDGRMDFAFLAINEGVIASASALKIDQEPTDCTTDPTCLPHHRLCRWLTAMVIRSLSRESPCVRKTPIPTTTLHSLEIPRERPTRMVRPPLTTWLSASVRPIPDQIKFTFVLNAEGLDSAAPTAVDDTASVLEDDSASIDVLSNDRFGGNGPAATPVTIKTGPDDGTATINDGGTANDVSDDRIDYTPGDDFFGTDSFSYQIEDSLGATSAATVTVTVDPVNDAPSFTKGPDQTVSENAGGQSVANWATDISIGPSNESSNQTLLSKSLMTTTRCSPSSPTSARAVS